MWRCYLICAHSWPKTMLIEFVEARGRTCIVLLLSFTILAADYARRAFYTPHAPTMPLLPGKKAKGKQAKKSAPIPLNPSGWVEHVTKKRKGGRGVEVVKKRVRYEDKEDDAAEEEREHEPEDNNRLDGEVDSDNGPHIQERIPFHRLRVCQSHHNSTVYSQACLPESFYAHMARTVSCCISEVVNGAGSCWRGQAVRMRKTILLAMSHVLCFSSLLQRLLQNIPSEATLASS